MRHFRAIYMHYDDVGNKNLELARHTNRARLSKWPNSSNLDPKYKQSKIQLCICARGKLLITYSTTKSKSFFSHFLLLLDVCVLHFEKSFRSPSCSLFTAASVLLKMCLTFLKKKMLLYFRLFVLRSDAVSR